MALLSLATTFVVLIMWMGGTEKRELAWRSSALTLTARMCSLPGSIPWRWESSRSHCCMGISSLLLSAVGCCCYPVVDAQWHSPAVIYKWKVTSLAQPESTVCLYPTKVVSLIQSKAELLHGIEPKVVHLRGSLFIFFAIASSLW